MCALRILQSLTLLCCVLVFGCSQLSITQHQERTVLVLDNLGGYSYAGHRIMLRANGSYTDTTYTDVVGQEHTKTGNYVLNTEKTHLILSPLGGESQDLFRVDYGGQQYWVREADRERITQPSESGLRQVPLRAVP